MLEVGLLESGSQSKSVSSFAARARPGVVPVTEVEGNEEVARRDATDPRWCLGRAPARRDLDPVPLLDAESLGVLLRDLQEIVRRGFLQRR